MKKKITLGLLLGAMMTASLGVSAFAGSTVDVNTQTIDLGTASTYVEKDVTMVPLRIVAEKLGFTVTWNQEDKSIEMDNGIMKTTVFIGQDTYFTASSQATGMSAPTTYGVAPVLKEGVTYVPVNIFEALMVNDNGFMVDADTDTDEATEEDKKNEMVGGIPNPVKAYETVEDAKKTLAFKALSPSELPKDFKEDAVSTISDQTLQIVYRNGDNAINYRTAEGDVNLTGDYNEYEFTKTVKIGNNDNVTVKGNGDKIYNFIWTMDGNSYSIFVSEGLTADEVAPMINSIK